MLSLRKETELRETVRQVAHSLTVGAIVEGDEGSGGAMAADDISAAEIVSQAACAAAAGLHGVGDGRVVWLFEAIEQLLAARRTLRNTYAFAYFLSAGIERDLFDDLQAGLDSAVEALSKALEDGSKPPVRDEIVNLTEGARLRLRRLRERAEEGFGDHGGAVAEATAAAASWAAGPALRHPAALPRRREKQSGAMQDPIVLDDE
mmetsp:Transcript_36676/g.73099  ORF Transcript_36676/g.73099 Transcript_36676/m.73099 type:complete len:205 (-) Transcript_36676:446-1060(-)